MYAALGIYCIGHALECVCVDPELPELTLPEPVQYFP